MSERVTSGGGTRSTRQREAIRAALQAAGRPLSPQEVLDMAQHEVPTLGLATVYRTLKLLVDEDEISPVALPGDTDRYELRETAETHHHHFHCDVCDRVFDVEGCAGGLRDMLPSGFRLSRHELTLYGVCRACAKSGK